MYSFTSNEINVDELRARLQKMTSEELLRFGRAATYMCSPQANYHEPRQVFVVQLEEARTKWRRRKAGEEPDRRFVPSENTCFVIAHSGCCLSISEVILADPRIPAAR